MKNKMIFPARSSGSLHFPSKIRCFLVPMSSSYAVLLVYFLRFNFVLYRCSSKLIRFETDLKENASGIWVPLT